MNKTIINKIFLDIVMAILFILELNINITGFDLHEIIGLFVGIVFVLHLLFNLKWIKMLFNNKNKNNKLKISIIINILLFISFIVMIITGILISKFVFRFNISNYISISLVHKVSAYTCVGLVFIHLLMHFKYLKSIFIRIFKKNDLSFLRKCLLRISIIFFGLLILYILFMNIFNKQEILTNINQHYEEDYENKEESDSSNDSDNEDDNKNTNESNTTDETKQPESIEPKPSLQEYLSKLFCNGCGRHCPLISPRCVTGEKNAEVATTEYNEQYY